MKLEAVLALFALAAVLVFSASAATDVPDAEEDVPGEPGRSYVSSISIPISAVSIGERAFAGCESLESVTVHSGVREIGEGAFAGCGSLRVLTFAGSGDVSIAGNSMVLQPRAGMAIINVLDGGKLTIPASMIGGKGIAGATAGSVMVYDGKSWNEAYSLRMEGDSLARVVWNGSYRGALLVPPTVSAISDAYNGQIFDFDKSWVTSVYLADGVRTIGNNAFSGCDKMTEIRIPETVSSIGRNAFYGCSALRGADLPSGLSSIGWNAFYGCTSITSIEIPVGVSDISGAFYGCTSLKTVSLPSSLESVGDSAFYGCASLSEAEMPGGITSIGPSAFYRCSSLGSAELPSSVRSIGSKAFEGCTSLSSLSLPEGLRTIGYRAFSGCSALEALALPASVEKLGDDAFYGCASIKRIDLQGSPRLDVGSLAFPPQAELSKRFYKEDGSQITNSRSVSGVFELRYGSASGYYRTASS